MNAIVAVCEDWGIGRDGKLLVRSREDMRRFVDLTMGGTVVMGRKTFQSFPGGALKGRRNIVLTRSKLSIPGAETAADVEAALALVRDEPQVFVIGGESVYCAMLPYVDRVYVTKIDACPHSDAFFPNLDADAGWTITERGEEKEQDGLRYAFMTYERVGEGD